MVASPGGVGKSILGAELAAAKQAGRPFGGASLTPGRAVYVDAEMGPDLMSDLLENGGLPGGAFEYINAEGLGVEDLLNARLDFVGFDLVVLDSLTALTPGRDEKDADGKALAVQSLKRFSRQLDVGVLLIHHSGKRGGSAFRGHTSIVDHADAAFVVERARGGMLKLTCNPRIGCKMRGAPEPPDRWMVNLAGRGEGALLKVAEPPLRAAAPRASRVSAAERVEAALRPVIADLRGPVTKGELAKRVGYKQDNKSFREAVVRLKGDGTLQDAGQLGLRRAEATS